MNLSNTKIEEDLEITIYADKGGWSAEGERILWMEWTWTTAVKLNTLISYER